MQFSLLFTSLLAATASAVAIPREAASGEAVENPALVARANCPGGDYFRCVNIQHSSCGNRCQGPGFGLRDLPCISRCMADNQINCGKWCSTK